jgi:hypothetical protein
MVARKKRKVAKSARAHKAAASAAPNKAKSAKTSPKKKVTARSRPQKKSAPRLPVPRLDELFDIIAEALKRFKAVEVIQQNAIFERMQNVWNRATPVQRLAILNEHIELRQRSGDALVQGYVALGRKLGTLRNDADIQHAVDDWFGGYFEGPVVESFVAGSIVACQRSLETGLPIGIYWVAGAGNELKIAVAQSAHQITMLMLTPPQPLKETRVRALGQAEQLWVVAPQEGGVSVQQVYASALAAD